MLVGKGGRVSWWVEGVGEVVGLDEVEGVGEGWVKLVEGKDEKGLLVVGWLENGDKIWEYGGKEGVGFGRIEERERIEDWAKLGEKFYVGGYEGDGVG